MAIFRFLIADQNDPSVSLNGHPLALRSEPQTGCAAPRGREDRFGIHEAIAPKPSVLRAVSSIARGAEEAVLVPTADYRNQLAMLTDRQIAYQRALIAFGDFLSFRFGKGRFDNPSFAEAGIERRRETRANRGKSKEGRQAQTGDKSLTQMPHGP